jgi:hypothetical protein
MRLNFAHISGWMVIVVVTVVFIGQAYASPTGAFEQWERSRLVRQGAVVGEGSRVRASGAITRSLRAGGSPARVPSPGPGDYLEDSVRPDESRPVAWEFEGETAGVNPESRGHAAERELSPDGIWDGRDADREEPSRPELDPYGDDPYEGDR